MIAVRWRAGPRRSSLDPVRTNWRVAGRPERIRARPSAAGAGFTLMEIVLIVAVLAVLATAVTPAIVQRIMDARVDATRVEMKALYEAMVGRSSQSGSYGFVGDMGRLPQTFTELAQGIGVPAHSTQTVRTVGMGWNGPYVNIGDGPTDYLNDGFGRPYTGASSGQVRSAGPDGVAGNNDDLVYPPTAPVITGRISVTVKEQVGNATFTDPTTYDVKLYYSNGGTQAVLTDSAPPFVFDNVPMGLHAVQVIRRQQGTLKAEDTVASRGSGQTTAVELWFER